MKNIILIAPPAAGKGTQSEILVKNFGYVHISMGDLLREVVAKGDELGQKLAGIIASGALVDDDLTIDLIRDKLLEIKGQPFIVDGFPRTFYQSQAFQKVLAELGIDNYEAILLNLSEKDAIKRISGRLICKCGKSYNLNDEKLKPIVAGICDKCGEALVKRDDDNVESFKKRYEVFTTNIESIKKYYASLGKLKVIDVNRPIAEISADIEKEITND